MKDEKMIKRLLGYSFAVMVIVLCVAMAVKFRVTSEQEAEERKKAEALTPKATMIGDKEVMAIMQGGHATYEEVWEVWQFLPQDTKEQLSEAQIRECILIKKPEGEDVSWQVSEYLPDFKIGFTVEGAQNSITSASVLRVWSGEYYYGMPAEEEILKELTILSWEEDGKKMSEISMIFDRCYIPQITEMEDYYVIQLQSYKEVYDRIVVIDAGHGGKDKGAGAHDYAIHESKLNLKMLLYLKELLEQNTDIKVFCTRTEDVYPSLDDRVELAVGLEADLFVSWHCNSFTSESKSGTEVLYSPEQGVNDAFNSKAFAQICQRKLVQALGTKDNGIKERQDLRIIRKATMPVALMEVAYLSNESDLAILLDDEMLQKAAQAIYESIMEAYSIMEETGE